MSYLTALAQTDLGGHIDYVTQNLIEKWFQTLKMRVERFQNTWMGGRASVRVVSVTFAHQGETLRCDTSPLGPMRLL